MAEAQKVDPRDQLVLDEARRALDQQVRDVENIRARAGSLAALAVAVSGFLGGLNLRDGAAMTWATWCGLASAFAAIACCVSVLWPRDLEFILDINAMDGRIDGGHTAAQMTRDTSLGLEAARLRNSGRVEALLWAYVGGLALVVLAVSFLLFDLAGR